MKNFSCCLLIILSVCINVNANLQDGLVIHFSFDQIDGDTVVNEADTKIDGTLEGEAEQVAGYWNMGIALNADADEGTPGEDFIRVANSSEVNVGEQFTIAVWAKATNFSDYRTLMSNTDSSGYALTVENSMPSCWVHVDGDYLQVSGETELQEDTWYHLALTFDGTDGIIYLDGKEDGKGTREGNVTLSTSDFFIGAEPSGQAVDSSYPAWHGVLDEFYFYNRALTKEEIDSLIKQSSAVEPIDKMAVSWGRLKKI